MRKSVVLFLMTAVVLVMSGTVRAQIGTAFTYQGELSDGGSPAAGEYDFNFELYDDDDVGSQVGGTIFKENVNVGAGTFTVALDFGSGIFTGDVRWLQIGVRPGEQSDPCDYTILSPRQELTPTPYAMYALNSAGGSGFWAANSNDIYNTNSGNVGVGTENPMARFEVAGGDMLENLDQVSEIEADSSSAVHWQSFTVGITGKLTRIEIYSSGNAGQNSTYYIYAGEGTGGTLLHTDSISMDPGWRWDTLSTPVDVVAGVQCTLAFGPVLDLKYNSRDPYPGGRAGIGPGSDLCFSMTALFLLKNSMEVFR